MENINLSEGEPEHANLLIGWLDRAELARELTISVDTLQRWETRRVRPPCVRVGRKVLFYRKDAVREWLCEQESRKTGAHPRCRGPALRRSGWDRLARRTASSPSRN